MENRYESGEYLSSTRTWHAEDSAWKARQILRIVGDAAIEPSRVLEVGCGVGRVLEALSGSAALAKATFDGYDISAQAIGLCPPDTDRLHYKSGDPFLDNEQHYDLLLAIDVFEHVPDYLGFLEKCRAKATYKIYHIPLDIHVSAVCRASFIEGRASVGHLHYFSAESALMSLIDTGHEVLDSFYTCGSTALLLNHFGLKRWLAAGPRWVASRLRPAWGARFLGGYSLMVLCR